jgi:hypothetical protein
MIKIFINLEINENKSVKQKCRIKRQTFKERVDEKGLGILRKLGLNDISILIIDRLEYWFDKYPDGFDKHGNDCADQLELDGLCWADELDMTKKTFKKYFREIGLIHNSLEEYSQAKWKFYGNFYCSVLDESNHRRTRYYRNHKLANILRALIELDKNLDMGLKK